MGKVKFPLEMKDGYKVKTLEELLEHFDIERVMEYYFSGKLQNWLDVHYYDEILDEIEKLKPEQGHLDSQIANLFGIKLEKTNVDTEEIQDRVVLTEKIKKYVTDDVLEQIDLVAETQEKMEELMRQGKHRIYLFEGEFCIRKLYKNIEFIGINNPIVSIEAEDRISFLKQKIKIRNVHYKDKATKNKTIENDFLISVAEISDILDSFYKVFK